MLPGRTFRLGRVAYCSLQARRGDTSAIARETTHPRSCQVPVNNHIPHPEQQVLWRLSRLVRGVVRGLSIAMAGSLPAATWGFSSQGPRERGRNPALEGALLQWRWTQPTDTLTGEGASLQPAGIPARNAKGRGPAPERAEESPAFSETELITAVRAGEPEAVGILYRTYRDPMLHFATALLHDGHGAEDVFHEAFTKTISAILHGHGPLDTLGPYLFRAVRTATAGWRAHYAREAPAPESELTQQPDPRPGPGPTSDPLGIEHVQTAFQSLPPRWQLILWYTEVENLPPRRIAPLLGLTPNAASALLHRARKGLRAAYHHTSHQEVVEEP